tara:strand:- start:390 stop:1103 length:714 start_codon:yes stop_codon:yes gene_type:complete
MLDTATGKPFLNTVAYYTPGVMDTFGNLPNAFGNAPLGGRKALAWIAANNGGIRTSTQGLGGGEMILKAMFGIGDWYGFPFDPSAPGTWSVGAQGGGKYYDGTYTPSLLLRGFKYGLINAVPTSPNAVFRYDTYGQFRDMLEQRPYTKFFVDNNLEESAVGITFVERLFVNGEFTGGRPIAPADTNSQNLSVFATSSVPYHDTVQGEREGGAYPWGRDRATPPPDISGIDTYSYDTD